MLSNNLQDIIDRLTKENAEQAKEIAETQEGYIEMLRREIRIEKRIRLRNKVMKLVSKILRVPAEKEE
jgi:hypothetical protein